MTFRDQFLAIPVRQRTAVNVAGIDETVYAHTITAVDQVELAKAARDYPDAPGSVLLVVYGIKDADGKPVFTPADIPSLSSLSATPVAELARAVTDQDKSEDIAKNS